MELYIHTSNHIKRVHLFVLPSRYHVSLLLPYFPTWQSSGEKNKRILGTSGYWSEKGPAFTAKPQHQSKGITPTHLIIWKVPLDWRGKAAADGKGYFSVCHPSLAWRKCLCLSCSNWAAVHGHPLGKAPSQAFHWRRQEECHSNMLRPYFRDHGLQDWAPPL